MSAKATYLGEEDGPEDVLIHGKAFTVGKAVEVSDDVAVRLLGNPFFRIDANLAGAVQKAVTDKAIADKVAGPDKAPATVIVDKK